MADNLLKRPSKGILKNSSSFDKQDTHRKSIKETTWDEMNIIATLHPPDKDYGHMKIDEPKTPFNYAEPDHIDGINLADLEEKIKAGGTPKALLTQDESEDEDEDLTPEEKAKKRDFESKRKKHYNEFYAVKLARKLLEEEEDDEEQSPKASPKKASPKQSPKRKPQDQSTSKR